MAASKLCKGFAVAVEGVLARQFRVEVDGGLEGLVLQQPSHDLILPWVGVEVDLGGEVPEQVRMHRQAGLAIDQGSQALPHIGRITRQAVAEPWEQGRAFRFRQFSRKQRDVAVEDCRIVRGQAHLDGLVVLDLGALDPNAVDRVLAGARRRQMTVEVETCEVCHPHRTRQQNGNCHGVHGIQSGSPRFGVRNGAFHQNLGQRHDTDDILPVVELHQPLTVLRCHALRIGRNPLLDCQHLIKMGLGNAKVVAREDHQRRCHALQGPALQRYAGPINVGLERLLHVRC